MYYVYILASKRNGTLYVGMTNNLDRRVLEHRTEVIKGFTSKYKVKTLVYFEQTENLFTAVARERRLKRWPREWKKKLIERHNPQWKGLFPCF